LLIKYIATKLARARLINPERSTYINVELIQGMSMEPTELIPRQRLNPKLLALEGYISKV
jgi:hypothetical protein